MDDITVYTGKNKKKDKLGGGVSQNNIVNNVNSKGKIVKNVINMMLHLNVV